MPYTSFIDPEHELPVNAQIGVMGIFHKPEGRKNPEHAFILLESSDASGAIYFERYDFVADESGQGKVIIKPLLKTQYDKAGEALKVMLQGERIDGQCWFADKKMLQKLRELVANSKVNPGQYALAGNAFSVGYTAAATHAVSPEAAEATRGLVAETAESMSGAAAGKLARAVCAPSAHNCFTWARSIFLKLGDERIRQALPFSIGEFFEGSRTTHYLNRRASKNGGGGSKASNSKQTLHAGGDHAAGDEDDEPRTSCVIS